MSNKYEKSSFLVRKNVKLFRILGFCPVQYNEKENRVKLTWWLLMYQVIIFAAALTHALLIRHYLPWFRMNSMSSVLFFSAMGLTLIYHCVISGQLILTIRYQKSFLNRIIAINEMFINLMKVNLDYNTKYKRMRKIAVIGFLFAYGITFFLNLPMMLVSIETQMMYRHIFFPYFYFTTKTMELCFTIEILKSVLDTLNECLESIVNYTKVEWKIVLISDKFNKPVKKRPLNTIADELRVLMKIYNEIYLCSIDYMCYSKWALIILTWQNTFTILMSVYFCFLIFANIQPISLSSK